VVIAEAGAPAEIGARSSPPAWAPAAAGVPQTSQYPSTIVPVQPGWVHGAPSTPAVAAAAVSLATVEGAAEPSAGPGLPQTSQ